MRTGTENNFDVAIAGGGLAGLTLAITLADKGFSCVLFEKNTYPFHKVCGEYIAMESRDFLSRCGVALDEMNLPRITKLQVSSQAGKVMKHDLQPGGFGISRFLLDHELSKIAVQKGVTLYENCRVDEVEFSGSSFRISTSGGKFTAKVCAGSWGKKSNLDSRLARAFTANRKQKNYIGIKYHVRIGLPPDLIGLHSFRDGYCGISRVEGDRYCLCYLTSAANLKKCNGDISSLEKKIIQKNPLLQKYFSEAEFLFTEPLAISNIRIGYKSAVENHVLMLGDAAGSIAPLSGNGMSMALRSSHLASGIIDKFLEGSITRSEMEKQYEQVWRQNFRRRIDTSAVLQRLMKNTSLSNSAIALLKRVPLIRAAVVRSTHGKPF